MSLLAIDDLRMVVSVFSFLLNLLSIIYKLYRLIFLYLTLKMKEKMKNSSKLTDLDRSFYYFLYRKTALHKRCFLLLFNFKFLCQITELFCHLRQGRG